MALSFATDIRPLFREGDIRCMKNVGVELDDPAVDVCCGKRAGGLRCGIGREDASG